MKPYGLPNKTWRDEDYGQKSVPVNEEVSDTSCTEKVESKESTKLSDNFQTVTLENTTEVKPKVVYGVATGLLFLSIWHPYWALFAAIAFAVHKYSENWEDEVEEEVDSNIDIKGLLKSRKEQETKHTETDVDYVKGVYIARRNKKKIAKAIANGDQYCLVYVGWQDHPSWVRNGIANELGLKSTDVHYSSYPLFMEVWF